MERTTKIGLPLTVLAIVGTLVIAASITANNITPAAAQGMVSPLDPVRQTVDRAFAVVENPEQLLGLLLDGREAPQE